MKNKILDNLTGQEIKELINTKEIILQDLDSNSLRKLMDNEIDMICYGEGDVDLITQCTDILTNRDKSMISKEEFMDIIERTKAERVIIVDKKDNKPKARIIFKRAILVAAIASFLLLSSCCVLKLIPDICQYIANIARQPEGTEKNIDEFTFYHNGEAKKYNSIEEMVEAEDLDIMYPTKWPEGVEVESIRTTTDVNGNEQIQITTNNVNVNFTIILSSKALNSSNDDVFVYNKINFYIKKDETYIANCYFHDDSYYISANSREDLILIIKNLKE